MKINEHLSEIYFEVMQFLHITMKRKSCSSLSGLGLFFEMEKETVCVWFCHVWQIRKFDLIVNGNSFLPALP